MKHQYRQAPHRRPGSTTRYRTHRSACRGLRPIALVSLGLCGAAGAAPSAVPELPEGQTLLPYVYANSGYNSNLFRTSGDSEARAVTGGTDTSDVISRAGAGMDMKWPISLQTLRFDGWVERAHYDQFDTLDHTAGDLNGAWDWEIGRLWSGTLDAGYSRTLNNFSELQQVERDMKTTRHASLDAGFRFLPDWEVIVGGRWRAANHNKQDNLDRTENTTFAELRYHSTVDSHVGLRAEHTIGNLDQPEVLPDGSVVSNDYRENRYGLVIGWAASAKSYLEGRAGVTHRDYKDVPGRDFNGFTTRLDYHWQATGKTAFVLSGWRELDAQQDEISTYTVTRGVSVQPIWDATEQLRVRGRLAFQHQDFQGAEGTGTTDAGRKDTVRTAGLGMDYAFRRNILVSLDALTEKRNSNRDQDDYRYSEIFAGVSYGF